MKKLLMVWLISLVRADIPGCDYFDTVGLTETMRLANGSYKYMHVVIPPEQTGDYDYEILDDGTRESVPTHLRGCACKLGNCIRFCCSSRKILDYNERTCSDYTNKDTTFDPLINITLPDGSVVERHVYDDFIVQEDLPVPCSSHFHLDKYNEEDHGWTLYQTGELQLHFNNDTLSKQKYCLQPHPISMGDDKIVLITVPHKCEEPQPSQWMYHTLRLLSSFCLALTIFTYLYIPQLRTLHGFCFVFYMLCMMLANLLLVLDSLNNHWTALLCKISGYLGYFCVQACFHWMSVISYDLWCCFRQSGVHHRSSKKSFLIYNIYAWGVPTLQTILIIILDSVLDRDDENQILWMPGVALYNCWVKTHDWSAALYFHGPMAILILFNITMFVLTIIRILEEKQSVAMAEEHVEKRNNDKQKFFVFMRLFVIMGVLWIFEVFAYLAQNNAVLNNIFMVSDYVNSAQGIIIFIMFVMKPSVLKLFSNRIRGIDTAEESSSEEEIALHERNDVPKMIGPSILN